MILSSFDDLTTFKGKALRSFCSRAVRGSGDNLDNILFRPLDDALKRIQNKRVRAVTLIHRFANVIRAFSTASSWFLPRG